LQLRGGSNLAIQPEKEATYPLPGVEQYDEVNSLGEKLVSPCLRRRSSGSRGGQRGRKYGDRGVGGGLQNFCCLEKKRVRWRLMGGVWYRRRIKRDWGFKKHAGSKLGPDDLREKWTCVTGGWNEATARGVPGRVPWLIKNEGACEGYLQ